MSPTATADKQNPPPLRAGALFDVAMTIMVLAAALALFSSQGIGHSPPDGVGWVVVAGASLPLVLWRRYPLGVLVVTATASALQASLNSNQIGLAIGPAVALYLLAADSGERTHRTWRLAVVVAGLFLSYLLFAAVGVGGFPGTHLLHTGLAWAVAWFAGERTRLRRERSAQLEERSRRLDREAAQDRMLAVAEERARIARDLHDSAGHTMGVIGVRAGAARMRHHQDPQRSLLALEVIEDLARQTVEEIDRMVGSLRGGGSANEVVEAPPGLASLETLIARHREAGLDVAVEGSAAPVPQGSPADQATYRILQEALTNAARHGAGSALVKLGFRDSTIRITVSNPVPDQKRPSGGGHGLPGMRERAGMLGGSLRAKQADGTYVLEATVPVTGGR